MQQIHTYLIPEGASEDPDGILEKDEDYQNRKAVYTSIRTYDGKPYMMDEHLIRLKFSARLLDFEISHPFEVVRLRISELITSSVEETQFLKITATPSNLVIISRPLTIDDSIYNGVSVLTTNMQRENVQAKTFPTIEMKRVYHEAHEQGHHDVFLLDKDENITEGSRSNVMWIKGSILYWCAHALSGITQAEVIRCAIDFFDEGIITRVEKVHEGLPLSELSEIDELFLTQTSRGIVPVTQVNDVVIGNGKVGPKTKALRTTFHQNILQVV
jgi:branched-chain amino acid aminotransferase